MSASKKTGTSSMATEVIVVHNHLSCNLSPSQNDKALTAKVKGALKMIDVILLDHLIIFVDGYFSFSDKCLLWWMLPSTFICGGASEY